MRQRVDQQSAVGCPRDDCHHPRWSTITTAIADPTAVIESAVDVVSLGVRSVATLRHRDVPIRPQGSEFMRDRESKSLSYAGTRRPWTHHIAITLDGVNQGNAGSSALLADVSWHGLRPGRWRERRSTELDLVWRSTFHNMRIPWEPVKPGDTAPCE